MQEGMQSRIDFAFRSRGNLEIPRAAELRVARSKSRPAKEEAGGSRRGIGEGEGEGEGEALSDDR